MECLAATIERSDSSFGWTDRKNSWSPRSRCACANFQLQIFDSLTLLGFLAAEAGLFFCGLYHVVSLPRFEDLASYSFPGLHLSLCGASYR